MLNLYKDEIKDAINKISPGARPQDEIESINSEVDEAYAKANAFEAIVDFLSNHLNKVNHEAMDNYDYGEYYAYTRIEEIIKEHMHNSNE